MHRENLRVFGGKQMPMSVSLHAWAYFPPGTQHHHGTYIPFATTLALQVPPRHPHVSPRAALGQQGDIPGCGPGPALLDSGTSREASPPRRAQRDQAETHSSSGPDGHEPAGDSWGP